MYDGVKWIHLGQNRNQWLTVVNAVLKLLPPFLDQSSNCYFSRRTLLYCDI